MRSDISYISLFCIITFAFIVSHCNKKINKKILTLFGTTGDREQFGKTRLTFAGSTIKEIGEALKDLGAQKLDFTTVGLSDNLGRLKKDISAVFKLVTRGRYRNKHTIKGGFGDYSKLYVGCFWWQKQVGQKAIAVVGNMVTTFAVTAAINLKRVKLQNLLHFAAARGTMASGA